MLFWFNFFLVIFFLLFLSYIFLNKSILILLLHSEILLITFIFILISLAISFNINYLFGLAICYLVLGGMEIALNLLLLIINC